MTGGLTLILAIASFSPTVGQPRFADEIPKGVGYIAVLEILPDEDGFAKTCALNSVHELAEPERAINATPSDAYVMDACRKLHTAKWLVKRDAAGSIETQFYFCKYVESSPNTAFCDRQLGE
jgi:hypothetical protein